MPIPGEQLTGFSSTIETARAHGKFLLETLHYAFDVARIREDYQRILGSCALMESPRRDGSTLRSFSLTHRPDADDPLHDGNNTQYAPDNTKLFHESDFSVFNPAFRDTVFYDIYQAMPFQVGRMRINRLPERTVFTMHQDSAARAHVAIVTNPNCFVMSGDAQAYHVPADGNAYVFDTKQDHTALNTSREDRIHLTMAVADDDF